MEIREWCGNRCHGRSMGRGRAKEGEGDRRREITSGSRYDGICKREEKSIPGLVRGGGRVPRFVVPSTLRNSYGGLGGLLQGNSSQEHQSHAEILRKSSLW
eukprot:765863-Hanusia_phi.AAC.2